jgi:hypothetical protein
MVNLVIIILVLLALVGLYLHKRHIDVKLPKTPLQDRKFKEDSYENDLNDFKEIRDYLISIKSTFKQGLCYIIYDYVTTKPEYITTFNNLNNNRMYRERELLSLIFHYFDDIHSIRMLEYRKKTGYWWKPFKYSPRIKWINLCIETLEKEVNKK